MVQITEGFYSHLLVHHNVIGHGCHVAEHGVVLLHGAVALHVLHVLIGEHRKGEVLKCMAAFNVNRQRNKIMKQ